MLWRFSRALYDRRGRGQDPLLGLNSEDEITGAAPRVLAHPGVAAAVEALRIYADYSNWSVRRHADGGREIMFLTVHEPPMKWAEDALAILNDSAVWEPHGLGLGPSQPEATLQAASRIAEAPYPDGPLASRKAP